MRTILIIFLMLGLQSLKTSSQSDSTNYVLENKVCFTDSEATDLLLVVEETIYLRKENVDLKQKIESRKLERKLMFWGILASLTTGYILGKQ